MEVDWLICSQPWRTHEIDYYSSYLKYVVCHSFLGFSCILKTGMNLWIIIKKEEKRKQKENKNFPARHLSMLLLSQRNFH